MGNVIQIHQKGTVRLEKEAGYPFQHVHAVGSFGWEWFPEKLKELGVEEPKLPFEEDLYKAYAVKAKAFTRPDLELD